MTLRLFRWGVLVAIMVVAAVWYRQGTRPAENDVAVVQVLAGRFSYRLPGEFSRAGRPVDAPLREQAFARPLAAMRHQVTEADYERCVASRVCKARAQPHAVRADFPVTGVSWEDARSYAAWLSQQTGEAWRLPTDAEWSYIAGTKYHDDALLIGEDADVIERWMARYDKEAQRDTHGNEPERIGTFGVNEHGLADLSGNVWEWTDTCFSRQELGSDEKPFVVCGIRVAAGQHRAYVSDFIRDARGGGCAAGIPPTNLGFRLIREDKPSLWNQLRAWSGKR